MENTSPEKTITAVCSASATVDSKGVIDRQFPDLRKTFTDPSFYNTPQQDVVKPLVIKQTITMPVNGLNAIQQLQPNGLCGIVPSIDRAYFVNKNLIYIWDYTQSRDIVTLQEEDDIISIGFVKPKPGIFIKEMKQLLIVSTTREVRIVGLIYDPKTGLKIFNTDMSTNTAGVNMIDIVGTDQGRIFMLGSDGNVWELDYRSEESWFVNKCSKKLHTSGSLFAFLFGQSQERVIQIAVNQNGTVLYQLTTNSNIYVTYLGTDGNTFNTVYKKTDILSDARKTNTNSNHLRLENFKIVSIHPTTSSESIAYHLVAVTSSGCRIYFSHHQDGQYLLYDALPNGLTIVHIRSPSDDCLTTADQLDKIIYNQGLLMAIKQQQDKIIFFSPDLGNLANCTSNTSDIRLTEFYGTIDIHGKVLSLVESTIVGSVNELMAPYNSPSRHFLVLTTSGLTVIAKQRPVDILYRLLMSSGRGIENYLQEFESFFSHFGYVNSCALCFNLICANTSVVSDRNNPLYYVEPVTDTVEEGAKALLERFGQVPSLLNTLNTNSRETYSSRHDGLALFIYRIIHPIWSKKLVKMNNEANYETTLLPKELKNVQQILRKLASFIERNPVLFPKTPNNHVTKSYENLHEFVIYLTEAISFFDYLIETGISSIVSLMKPDSQAQLLKIDLKTLLTTTEGRLLASDLSSALISHTFKKIDNTTYVIDVLTQCCGSFCDANDVLLYKASDQIYAARNAPNTNQAKLILTDSLNILNKIAIHIPAGKASEIANQFALQGYHVYGVRLAIVCAQARDPKHVTTSYIQTGQPPNDPRLQILQSKEPFYEIVFNLLYEVVTKNLNTSSSQDDYKKRVFSTAFSYDDRAFQYYIYEKFIEKKMGQELIKASPPHLEEFLNRTPFTYDRLSLLAVYYRCNERYEEAAHTYVKLARFVGENISLNTRIDNLTSASICAKSVTTPAKQYEMYHLLQEIESLLELARKEAAATITTTTQ
ncbi:Nup133 N terminal like-domain-containing protein [Cokeromyces recurvatus]|uniref:Nup133 N terminal like-domain-containing protein n=1 Tax=Cokeromyces recurvatus TaxID=90255 RepID=UPI00221FC6AB|nr:Nup133 N terminal like-domain-containing protein [Cokeromyces recurvatus]KAI7898791.1 Nup133 N terminal like-domain-containing protein [Cokeromyces recurvatus]